MAVKTFTAGSVLTAADTNTYLANSGLVYVASGSLSTATTNFQGCFTSAYRNYRIVMDNVSASAGTDIWLRMLSGLTPLTTSSYYYAYRALASDGTNKDTSTQGSIGGFLNIRFSAVSQFATISMDIFDPQLSLRTQAVNSSQYLISGAYCFSTGGFSVDNTNSYDGFQISSLGAATLTGNVTIYGYRKV